MKVTRPQLSAKITAPSRPNNEYTLFILCLFQGQIPVVVLRDTRASQSLLLKDKLPLESNTYIGSDVLIQGVDLEVMSIPLH